MTPILVYGFPQGSSLGLIAAFEWLGHPYRLSRVDMLSEMQNKQYARLNGRQETPVFVTSEGQAITETMAISAWLEFDDKEHRISYPAGTAERLKMIQFAAFINTGFTSAFGPLWAAMESDGSDSQVDDVLRRTGVAAVRKRHAQLEAMVGDSRYLTGERPTIADALFIGVARWLEVHNVAPRGEWPKLDRIRRQIEELPAYRFAERIELGGSPASDSFQGHVPLAEVISRYGARP